MSERITVLNKHNYGVKTTEKIYTLRGEKEGHSFTFTVAGDQIGTVEIGVSRYGVCPNFRNSATAVNLARRTSILGTRVQSRLSVTPIDDQERLLGETDPMAIFSRALQGRISHSEDALKHLHFGIRERASLSRELEALRRIQETFPYNH